MSYPTLTWYPLYLGKTGHNSPRAFKNTRPPASGGAAPCTFSINSGVLPAGLNLNATTGVISGVPTAAGDFTLQVRVQDANGCFALQSVRLNIISFAIGGIFRDGSEGGPQR